MKSLIGFISKNKENSILYLLSIILAITTLLFIAREVEELNFLNYFSDPNIFYSAYIILTTLVLGIILFFQQKFFLLKPLIKKLLLVYLPTEIILSYGLSKSIHFHYIFNILTGIYAISAGFFIINLRNFKWKENPQNNFLSLKNWVKSQGKINWLIIFLVIATNLIFGTYHLGKFAAVDEPLWTFDRIPSFWKNIEEKDWKGTNISDKPGITVAMISGAGLLSEQPKAYKSAYGRGLIGTKANPANFEKMNFAFRFPIYLFMVLMLPFFYFLIERLLGKNIAIFSFISIGLSPILIGMTSIINPDAILWIFAPLSLISFLTYQKRKNSLYLYMSGVLLGLALLTKYVANILSVFFLVLIFSEYIFHKIDYKSISLKKYLKESFADYLILFFTSLVTFYILFPAAWIKPSRLLKGTIFSQAFEKTWPVFILILVIMLADIFLINGKISTYVLDFLEKQKKRILIFATSAFLLCIGFTFANVFMGMRWYDFEAIISSPKSAYSTGGYDGLFFANFFPLVFTITPITFFFLIFALYWSTFKEKFINRTSSTVFTITLFIFTYYLATTINKVAAMNRYQIIIFPLAIILGGIGMGIMYAKISEKKYAWKTLFLFAVFLLSSGSVYFSRPLYISYDSPLLPRKYYTDLKDMGTGSYEAANFINSLPDVENLTVWTDKKGVCSFLRAKCVSGFTYEKLRSAGIDYAVVSAGRSARTKKMITPTTVRKDLIRFDTLYDRNDADVIYKLEINGRPRNFIKVIKLDQEFFDLYKNL